MRLKPRDGSVVLHASRPLNIHDNGFDHEYNHIPGSESTQLIQRSPWEKVLVGRDNYSKFQEESPFSPLDSPADDLEGESSGTSSSDTSPEGEDYRVFSQSSDTDSEAPPPPPLGGRGITNPNYPGFQHFASQLLSCSDSDEDTCSSSNNNNNNNSINNNNNNNNHVDVKDFPEKLNQLDSSGGFRKTYYDKPKFNISTDSDECSLNEKLDNFTNLMTELNIPEEVGEDVCNKCSVEDFPKKMMETSVIPKENKMADAFLSGVKDEVKKCEDSNRAGEKIMSRSEDQERKREKTEMNRSVKGRSQPANVGAHQPPANMTRGASLRRARDKKRSPDPLDSFDVYNIETAMPVIDLDAIENHLRAAREEERRRRNDREEIRRRLATGCDGEEFFGGDRPGRKPSLQARLQSGMNLQICFMNDTMSDTESPNSESEPTTKVSPVKHTSPLASSPNARPALGNHKHSPKENMTSPLNGPETEADFFARQARLQQEARLALAQAKDLARLHMEVERQKRQVSPITEMLRTTLLKVGVVFPQDRRRVSRQMLTEMNVAQLQVIVNDLHTQIEFLNESLVKFLMDRDELHMSQDSMLVDIEDLTRYLGAKESTIKEEISVNNNLPTAKPKNNRISVHK